MQPISSVLASSQPDQPGLPAGSVRTATVYFDDEGRRRRAAEQVPVDQYGKLAGLLYRCRKCKTGRWFALGLKGQPVCELHNLRMQRQEVKAPPLLPYRQIWDVCERPLRPVWSLPALAAAGWAVDAAPIPALVLAGAAPLVGVLACRVAERQEIRAKVARGRLEEDDPEGGKRLRVAIARRARAVGYTAAGGTGWLALAAALGMDPHTVGGKIALAALGLMWAWPAATWWRKVRRDRNRPAPVVDVVRVDAKESGFGEIIAQRWVDTVGAVGSNTAGEKPTVAGSLPGTQLEGVHRVTGGWAATIVDPLQRGLEWGSSAARRNIAAVFGVGIAAVSLEAQADDANRCFVMVQPKSPLAEVVRWDGPRSVDATKGGGMAGRYADGTTMFYEVYRPGWGCPHDALFGTTGSGKSEMFCQLMTIDRWMHHVDDQGVAHGMVADFLIDPQHGQSFGPFLDDLAAPVASTLGEAMLLVEALEREGLRRNAYLARVTWPDPKRRNLDGSPVMRRGRKFWDPFVDGPMLVLNIDEAHFFLSNRVFAERITAAARMWRKCGMKVRIATHTPLLSDLGGSTALRDMLTGGFVWVGRTANGLTSGAAFNGQLPVDPRSIPKIPGMSYALTGMNPRALLMRSAWESDYYDWVRDDRDRPIGYPAALPQVTLDTFGPEFARWAAGGEAAAQPARADVDDVDPTAPMRCLDAVLLLLALATGPVDMDELRGAMRDHNLTFSIRTVRDALAALRKADPPMLETVDGRHQLTQRGLEEALTRKELLSA